MKKIRSPSDLVCFHPVCDPAWPREPGSTCPFCGSEIKDFSVLGSEVG